jgi:hypothetical protein
LSHVFVESNWVFEYVEPEFKRKPAAGRLVARAAAGELVLHIPAICLREGAESVRRKCQPRHELGEFRRFVNGTGALSTPDTEVVRGFLEAYDQHVKAGIDGVDARLDDLRNEANVEVFALSDEMLGRVLDLRRSVVEVNQMKPFDEAILAAVIVRAETLSASGTADLTFCTLDSDLLPWTKKGEARPELKKLYDGAGVSVLASFAVP